MRYYDLKRHWTRRIEPHLADELLNEILIRDFGKYTRGNWGKPFKQGQFPRDFDRADWLWWTPMSRPVAGDSSLLLAGSVA